MPEKYESLKDFPEKFKNLQTLESYPFSMVKVTKVKAFSGKRPLPLVFFKKSPAIRRQEKYEAFILFSPVLFTVLQ